MELKFRRGRKALINSSQNYIITNCDMCYERKVLGPIGEIRET